MFPMTRDMKKILLVDDNQINKRLIVRMLKDCGIIEEAEDGLEGLQKYDEAIESKEPFDLIILDIKMPGMNGYELLEIIRNIEDSDTTYHKSIVFMLSVLDQSDKSIKGFSDGWNEYFEKPITIHKLFEKMGNYNLLPP